MKILVVNIKHLGDLIISTAPLNALRKKYPLAEISVLVREEFKDVFRYNPNINKVLTFNTSLKGKKNLKKLIDGIKLILKIRKERFDVFIALHPGDRIAFLAWFSGAKIRIAPRKQTFHFLYNCKVDIYEDTISYIDYYNKIISAFDVKDIHKETEFFISDEEEEWSKEFFIENQLNNFKIVCIHPGASESSKIWAAENFVNLIKLLTKKNDIKILLLSGPNDKKICEEILKEIKSDYLVYYESRSILKSAALLKKSFLLVTNDTSTRHLAVALKIPVIALLPEDNVKCWDFYSVQQKHFTFIGKRINDNGYKYLGFINVEDVYKKIEEIFCCD
ncbi:MAG: glycosyltransferase family 9 protein [Melioribacter sp.]|nr:glycosyltransferase family 9 protein [Melioribacter sp.]